MKNSKCFPNFLSCGSTFEVKLFNFEEKHFGRSFSIHHTMNVMQSCRKVEKL